MKNKLKVLMMFLSLAGCSENRSITEPDIKQAGYSNPSDQPIICEWEHVSGNDNCASGTVSFAVQ